MDNVKDIGVDIEYQSVYLDFDGEFGDEIVQFWKKNGNPNAAIDFYDIVIVATDANAVIKLNILHTVDEFGNKLDQFGNKLNDEILFFSYVNKHYLACNKLYYFYNVVTPYPELYTNVEKETLYQKTRDYLLYLNNLDDDLDNSRGHYSGIVLRKKDDFLISKFNLKYCEINDDNRDRFNFDHGILNHSLDGVWYDNFDDSLLTVS